MSEKKPSYNTRQVSTLHEDKLRVASSVPGLKDKIQTKLEGSLEKIYWYIKFNMELDRNYVSKKTMNVTDIKGYILKTDITYDATKNCISIYPIDSYEADQYYLLNISKKVRSITGSNLKNEVHILFKLVNNRVDSFQVLKNSQPVAKPRQRPRDYEERFMSPEKIVRNPPIGKVYTFDKSKVQKEGDNGKLLSQSIKINVIVGIVGLFLAIISIALTIHSALIASAVIEGAGILHIILQLTSKKCRSVMAYNKGVRLFNAERYNGATIYFQRALALDPDSEIAEFAINKSTFYS